MAAAWDLKSLGLMTVRVRISSFPNKAGIAQLVEHLICNQVVTGSSPVIGSTTYKYNN